jgi:hypothetical protein
MWHTRKIREMHRKFSFENVKGIEHLQDLGINGG